MRPTVEDLQAIWLFTYSRSSLLDAAGFLAELDKVMMEGPSTVERGRKIAQLSNALDLRNDIVRRFTLGEVGKRR